MNKIKKQSTTKRILARISCVFVATIILLVAVASRMAIAVSDSYSGMSNATLTRLTARAVKECITTGTAVNTSSLIWSGSSDPDIFLKKVVETGSWVEQTTGGYNTVFSSNTHDGKMYCNENSDSLIKRLALLTGTIVNEDEYDSKILCNGDQPGLLTPTDYPNTKCGEDGMYTYNLPNGMTVEDYFENMYNEWADKNAYATKWDDIDDLTNFSDEEKYINVYNDMLTACGVDEPSTEQTSGSIPIKVVSASGAISTQYITPNSAVSSYKYNTPSIGGRHTCEELIEEVSDMAETMKGIVEVSNGELCYNEAAKNINSVTSQSLVNIYKGMRDQAKQSGDYSIFYDSEAGDCAKIEDEEGNVLKGGTIEFQEIIKPSEARAQIEVEDECFNHGVDALGHVICPVMKFLRDGVRTIYDNTIIPFLEIDAEAFKMGDDNSTFKAWQNFQSFANVAFVIFLLVIIFSQLTGVGIDNLGIKRMLPRLIVAAILVNLSYIICQLAVDASNIVGYAVENMFEAMASNAMVGSGANISGGNSTGQAIIASTIGIGGTAAVAIATAELWLPSVLLVAIPALISIIISVLFVFVILGARQAAAVILVVISPLALVCYMLPNTKKLFDRWLSAFKTVLLVFPICGLLIGGGAFAGAILMGHTQGYFIGQLLAALMTVVPFFFIPRVLKASLTAIGNLGATISNLGSSIGRSASGALRGSDGYKAAQKRAIETANRRKAGFNRDYKVSTTGKLKNTFANTGVGRAIGYSRMQQERVGMALKNKEEREKMSKYTDEGFIQAKSTQIDAEAREARIGTYQENFKNSDAFRSEDYSKGGRLEREVNAILDRGNEQEITSMVRTMGDTSDHTRDVLRNALADRTENGISAEDQQTGALSAVSNAIKENGGKWKNEYDRRMFDWATGNPSGGGAGQASLAAYNYGTNDAALSEKVSQDYMVKADDSAIAAMSAAVTSGAVTGKNLESYQHAAYQALNSDAAGSMKEERRAALTQIVGSYQPETVINLRDENAAYRRGKNDKGLYTAPASFKTASRETNSSGDTIFIDDKNRRWNASTGQYENKKS